MLASFLGSFPSLAVWVRPYCKEREAGQGFQGYTCEASNTSFALLAETWHYLCVAVSSMHQYCRTLVVNYFRCTSGTLPVQVLTRVDTNHHERRAIYIQLTPHFSLFAQSMGILLNLPAFHAYIRDAGHSKVLSWDACCDHLKTSISIYQKKALGELYRALPLSSCTFNVCVSYAHFHFFPYKFQLNENAKALCLYCTDVKGKNICVKAI